jgi:beta-xylosidase
MRNVIAGARLFAVQVVCFPASLFAAAVPSSPVWRTATTLALAALSGCAVISDSSRIYHNPILYADYSDPDVIRVGTRYYLVASSFHFSPGLPVLESRDLVHWSITAHVLARLDFHPSYNLPGPLDFDDGTERSKMAYTLGYRYASGVWAPSIRAHAGRLYIYFPTPTEGIFMTSAPAAAGPWDPPVKVVDQPGLEDPCPFWDEDGSAWLVHSRVGAGPLVLHRMSADGRTVLDAGKVIFEDPVHLPTLEGPKFYKRNRYYYIFAPFGGVDTGSEAVLRSRNISGPYEFRVVLSKGDTNVQGPHQGGYVETPCGEGWFVHFNSTGAYGRIVYLEPVTWEDDWPIIGKRIPATSGGEPVESYALPRVGGHFAAVQPQTSDEFGSPTLGLQWEWNHNPVDTHWSLTERPGFLRLRALPAPNLVSARNTLTQTLQARTVQLTARMAVAGMMDGQKGGLAMFGRRPGWIGVVQAQGQRQVVVAAGGVETAVATLGGASRQPEAIRLRLQVDDEHVKFAYSLDEGRSYKEVGSALPMHFSFWKAARPALFTFNTDATAISSGTNGAAGSAGSVDFDWLRVDPAAH